KDKPKEDFPKAPSMPEDMKEMYKQRQRELAVERAQMSVSEDEKKTEDNTISTPSTVTEPRLEDSTVAPKIDAPAEPRPVEKVEPAPVANPPQTRPRHAAPDKKEGKKGESGRPE